MYFLRRKLPLSSSSLKPISNSSNQDSFTVSYLVNSFGFTPERALWASKFVKLKTAEKPDSVVALFENHGFSKTQIFNIAGKLPSILLADPKKNLLPKFEFLYSLGISKADVAKALTTFPYVLGRSLKNQIIPSFNFRKNFIGSDAKFLVAFRRFADIPAWDHNSVMVNIEILGQHGVSHLNIVSLLTYRPTSIMKSPERFREIVGEVKEMGFNPLKVEFVVAVDAMSKMSKSTWKKKVEVYGRWGWSEEETMVAFRKDPRCMMKSEEKIMLVMDFLINTMGWESSQIARRPKFLSLSLEKRIVPRCSVFQVLLSKGLIKKRPGLCSLLESSESLFLQKFVIRYNEEAPQLLKLYFDKLGIYKQQRHGHQLKRK